MPVAAHSTTVPVVLEKSIRLAGSFKKTGPDNEELAAAIGEPSPSHAPNPSENAENFLFRPFSFFFFKIEHLLYNLLSVVGLSLDNLFGKQEMATLFFSSLCLVV